MWRNSRNTSILPATHRGNGKSSRIVCSRREIAVAGGNARQAPVSTEEAQFCFRQQRLRGCTTVARRLANWWMRAALSARNESCEREENGIHNFISATVHCSIWQKCEQELELPWRKTSCFQVFLYVQLYLKSGHAKYKSD